MYTYLSPMVVSDRTLSQRKNSKNIWKKNNGNEKIMNNSKKKHDKSI